MHANSTSKIMIIIHFIYHTIVPYKVVLDIKFLHLFNQDTNISRILLILQFIIFITVQVPLCNNLFSVPSWTRILLILIIAR